MILKIPNFVVQKAFSFSAEEEVSDSENTH